MITKVTNYIKQHHMIQEGNTILVGVSGGADSVCLLSVLSELREDLGLELICVHVNHLFRETAFRDEEYVQSLCKDLNIPCYIKRVDVKALAEQEKLTFEEAGRNVRYAFFEELREEYQVDKIAVAHNREDCAETVLFHLFRGSNIKGLGGIVPVNGHIIRPLLDTGRAEIEEYLRGKGIVWQTDETNASIDYSRNYIRHEILPAADKLYSGVEKRIADTAFSLQQAERYLEEQTNVVWEHCCQFRDGGIFMDGTLLLQEHPFMVSRVIYKVLEQVNGCAGDLTKTHVQDVIKLLGLQSGKQIVLPGDVYAYRTVAGILVRKETEPESASVVALLSRDELESHTEVIFDLKGLGNVQAKLLTDFDLQNIPQKTYTKWLDYDKINSCAVFRKRLEGDFLTIDEKGSRKKLKEYFIQEKIPAYKRDEIWILADDNHIMWVPGYRISSFYKVSEKTERVLELTIGGRENGED